MECNVITMRGQKMDALDFIARVQSRLKECLGVEVAEEELMERALRFGDLRLSTFIQESLNPLVGVVSLSADVSVPTMWTHYVLNTGIVVGYDTEVLRSIDFELRRVSYTEIAPVYEPTKGDVIQLQFADRERMDRDTRAGRTRNGTPILGTVELTQLGADWQALSRVKGGGKVVDVPPEAIKEIYGGVRTSDSDLARAAELARGEDKRGLFVGHVSSHAFRIQKTGGTRH